MEIGVVEMVQSTEQELAPYIIYPDLLYFLLDDGTPSLLT